MIHGFKDSFPFDDPRPQQVEILDWLEDNWDKYKYFIISAPAGVGKSGIAMSIADVTKDSYILTSTLMLQDQYQREFDGINDLRGKDNYDCNINRAFRVSAAPCLVIANLKKNCLSTRYCSYYNARDTAIRGECMITSYAYFLPAVECGPFSDPANFYKQFGKTPKRKVVICDEAHELEDQLVDFASVSLRPKNLVEYFGVKVDPETRFGVSLRDNISAAKRFKDAIAYRMNDLSDEIEETISKAKSWVNDDPTKVSKHAAQQVRDMVGKRDALDRMNKRLSIFFGFPGDPWIVESQNSGTELRITPVLARRTFSEFMDHMGEKHVFMSASMGDPKQLIEELGLDKSQVCCIETDTPFLPEKSPVKVLPVLGLNYREIDSNIDTMVDLIGAILEDHPDEKGIIHTGNYKLCRAILDRSTPAIKERLIGKAEAGSGRHAISNDQLVEKHKKSDKPTVLVSPSMHTGVDLKDDYARFQVIVKLPWPNLTDPRIARKKEISSGEWYVNEMIKKLAQASGRATRSSEDHSVTYVLDKSFVGTWQKSHELFPKWFSSRVIWL